MLEYVDPVPGVGSLPSYLFSAPGDWRIPEYQNIEWELLQLNNFFHGFQAIASTRVTALNEELAARHPGTQYVTEEDGTRYPWTDTSEIIPIYHYQLPFWQQIADFIVPATQLLLLFVLTEKSLKHLCFLYSLDWKLVVRERLIPIEAKRVKTVKKRESESMLTAYLRVLREDCGLTFSCPSTVALLDGKVREVRNSFGHGDWDAVAESVKEVHVLDAFKAFAELFAELARARLSSLPPESDEIPF